MKKRIFALLLALVAALSLLAGCTSAAPGPALSGQPGQAAPAAISQDGVSPSAGPADEADAPQTAPAPGGAAETAPPETETPAAVPVSTGLDEDGEYTATEDVAEYLHAYGHLPGNFITKRDALELGWPGGDLWEYAPGMSIGGDHFGNYEGLLPKDVKYRECDVNYAGGRRGAERLIYGDDGSVYYTGDHYASFTQLY